MSIQTHRFTIGDFQCIAINDGIITMGPTSIFFNGATPDELEHGLKKHGLKPDAMHIPVTCMLVDTGEQRVLIDCGAGAERLEEGLGMILGGLQQEGIEADSISHVILTHGHWDHVAGVADVSGTILYPNARFVMARGEWLYWTQGVFEEETEAENDEILQTMRQRLLLIESQLDLLDDVEQEIVPGITTIPTPGHTHHHLSVQISSEDQTLICTIDTMDHPLQIENPTWGAEWDMNREQAIASRSKILELAAQENTIMQGFHFPFPGLVRVEKSQDEWEWHTV